MRSPNRDRFIAALEHREYPEIPLFEYDPDMKCVNGMTGWNYPMSMHSFDLPAPQLVELNRIMGNDLIYFSHVWRVGRKEKNDTSGRIHYIDGTIKSHVDLDQIWFPDIEDVERRLSEIVELGHEEGFGIVYGSQSAAFTSTVAMGFEDFCLAVIDNPGYVHDLQARFQEYAIRELEMALRYPIDVAKIGSGLVTKNGPMLSPSMMEEFELRLLREQSKMIKSKGIPLLLHIDGFVEPMIPDFISMGVDILNPIELCDGMQDIYRIKEQYGSQITLSGNIDIDRLMLIGSPDEITYDVNRHIEQLSQGGGFMVSTSHNLHELIPVENYFALRDAVHGFRRS